MSSAVDAVSALDRVPGGVLHLSDDLRIVSVNRHLADLVGRRADELAGTSIDVLLSAPSRILFQTHVYPALSADGRVEEVLLSLAAADGTAIPVLFNAVRAADPGEVAYEALVVRIRARIRWEAELLEATRALEAERSASRALATDLAAAVEALEARIGEDARNREFRDAFVGVISHELRTPITTIFGMAHHLRRHHAEMRAEDVAARLDDVVGEADRLRRLTEDLLVLSRAEGSGLNVGREPIAITHVVRGAADAEAARSPEHRFEVAAGTGLPLVVGDQMYLDQVLRNYLGNATKYSPPGTTVWISAAAEAGGVAVRVADEGPGLPDGDGAGERLFELFYRAPAAIGQKEGAGIGLFVCRDLIRAMGGRVWAVDAPPPGRGAEFGFWLPIAGEEVDAE